MAESIPPLNDFNVICRACFAVSEKLASLLEDRVRQIYTEFTALNVSPEDGLPQNVCFECVSRCESGINFKEQCRTNEATLINYLAHGPELAAACEESEVDLATFSQSVIETSDPIELSDDDCTDREKKEEQEPTILCPYCASNFASTAALGEHLETEHSNANVITTQIIKNNQTQRNGRICPIAVNPNASIQCQFCEEIFRDTKPFERHIRGHNTETVITA